MDCVERERGREREGRGGGGERESKEVKNRGREGARTASDPILTGEINVDSSRKKTGAGRSRRAARPRYTNPIAVRFVPLLEAKRQLPHSKSPISLDGLV